MLIVLFLVSHFNFLFVPCDGLSWLPVSFLLHVKYTVSYRIVYSSRSRVAITFQKKVNYLLINYPKVIFLLAITLKKLNVSLYVNA